MTFGQAADFAIEAYHEPYGPEWGGFGRLRDGSSTHQGLFHGVVLSLFPSFLFWLFTPRREQLGRRLDKRK